jgi:YidC/Oxa1 family membrane protein insertase
MPRCLLAIQEPPILTHAGYFSLNVPSGLTLYWLTNNIVTTAQQLYLRSKFQPTAEAATPGATASKAAAVRQQEPEERKPSGVCCHHTAEMVSGVDWERGVAITAIHTNDDKNNVPTNDYTQPIYTAGKDLGSRRSSRGEKFRALKAREAATRAAQQAGPASPGGTPEVQVRCVYFGGGGKQL